MLSPRIQLNLQNAKAYFREHLSMGDYYAQSQTVTGEWFGLGAEKLGLRGAVGEKEFLALCEGLNPVTGQQLTARRNTQRRENGDFVANRRIFHDFAISPPKSVSVAGLLKDNRIVELHNRAVRVMLTELEKMAETRVRKSGKNGERATGELIVACFRHETSRELDPHLHTHCVVFNATFDPVEERWKALQTLGMYRARKYAENVYMHELALGLRRLGYELAPTARDFEIKSVPESVVVRFSKRHQQIDEEAKKQLAAGVRTNVADLRERIAREKRRRKLKNSTAERLRGYWLEQLAPAEKAALAEMRRSARPQIKSADAAELVAWAEEHLFERRSVVQDHELLSAALAHGRGQDFDLAALREAIEKRGYIREKGTRRLTTKEVLLCERQIVFAARDGQRRYSPFNRDYKGASDLSTEQRAAVRQILCSRDFITLFRGAAGTGKSFALKEVEHGLAAAGHPVVVLAPQRQQALDLEKDGLAAQTLAQLLAIKLVPQGAVIILDEAGQVGGRDLRDLILLANANKGRLILSGDTRQHGAVTASDALRAIEEHGEIKPAEIKTIRRQNPKAADTRAQRSFIRGYRDAVKMASEGKIAESFDRIDRLGCVHEIAEEKRRAALAHEYMTAQDRRETALVVAPTWAEVNAINEAIREQLKAAGKLGKGTVLTAWQATDATQAQKREPDFYRPGQRVFFHRRYGRFSKGESYEIIDADERGVRVMRDGRKSRIGYRYVDRITVASAREMEIAPGDRLQLKFNGHSAEGARLANGELGTVQEVRPNGTLVVIDRQGTRKTLSPSQRLFNRGYAVTSYASQGKTVDTVLIADDASRRATSRNQWYVAISRGRKRVVVFTANKSELRANIQRNGERELALDLAAQRKRAVFRRALDTVEHPRVHQSGGQRAGISI